MIYHGLKGVVCTETSISHIDGQVGKLVYRGYGAEYLAKNYTFEEVAYLLWFGKLPSREEVSWVTEELRKRRALPEFVKDIIKSLPDGMDMMSVMRTAVSSLGTSLSEQENHIEQAMLLTAVMPSIIGYRSSHETPSPEKTDGLTHIEYYLYLLTGKIPSKVHVNALETYMILTMEHGLNASTFSARVTASTESDMVSSITSAIGTMKGPLHGGAPTGVIDLLDEIAKAGNVEKVLREKLLKGEKLMGFGHRVYKTIDPRAVALKEKLLEMGGDDAWLDLAIQVEDTAIRVVNELKPGRSIYTNVEFYAAAIMKAIEMDPSLFTPTFTASRVVGWTAHVMEQAENNVIFRPESLYVGEMVNK